MQLQYLTSPALEARLPTDSCILIPIGSTEQHGAMGLIGTDALIAEAVAVRAGTRLDVVVAPVISIGMAQHHMSFPGSITLRPSTLLRVVQDIVDSLVRSGFHTLVFVNGHGGNVATVRAAFSEVHAEFSLRVPPAAATFQLELRNFYEGVSFKACARALYGAADGDHVTASEVAITQHLAVDAFAGRIGEIEAPRIAPAPANFYDAADFRRRFPDGRVGSDPSLARPEHGAQLLECAIEDLVADVRTLQRQAI